MRPAAPQIDPLRAAHCRKETSWEQQATCRRLANFLRFEAGQERDSVLSLSPALRYAARLD
jgi:hypothetical protein